MGLRLILMTMIAATAVPVSAQSPAATTTVVRSPDARNSIALDFDATGRPTYSVTRNGQMIIAASPVAITLDKGPVGVGSHLTGVDRREVDRTWHPVTGKASSVRDHFNEAVVHFVGNDQQRLDLVLRAYDDGVALRTVIPAQHDGIVVSSEETGFYFPKSYHCWGFNVGRFRTSHEGEFDPVDSTRIREHNLFDLPFLCETGASAFMITESDLQDYPTMYLKGRGDGGPGLVTKLSPLIDNPDVAARTLPGEPVRTPWRVIMLADKAGEFVQSNLVDNLAEPSRIQDTSWIRPGKSSSDWLSGGRVNGETLPVSSTRSITAFIDFAAENHFEYVMVDDGWYSGSGVAPGFDPKANIFADAPNFNLGQVAAHARKRGVRLWVWVDWRALDPVMEKALAYFQAQGIAGINVDFMDRDDQDMVRWYQKLFEAAARHKLMVELHGAFVPRGLIRTWPNFITQEGVLGSEYNKWSRRVTAEHNVMLAYTRGVLGPMDYIPAGFVNVSAAAFEPRWVLPMVQTTRAQNLAMLVVYNSPWTSLADSPDVYRSSPAGLDFIREVPTSWDETRFVAGDVGEYIVLARRKGDLWYLGAINGNASRKVSLPMSFLDGGSWTADLWLDGDKPVAIRRERRAVTAGGALELDLAATGGAVAVLRPR